MTLLSISRACRGGASLLAAILLLSPTALHAAELPPAPRTAPDQAALEDMPLLRLTPDKPQTVRLDKEAVNVLIGNDTHLHIIPDTSRNLILMPRVPGTTYFTVLDRNGDVIMQRHVVVAPPKQDYVRIRRACPAGDRECEPYSMYYCPDICHEMAMPVASAAPSPLETPDEVVASRRDTLTVEDGVDPADIPDDIQATAPPPTFVPSPELRAEAEAAASQPPAAPAQ